MENAPETFNVLTFLIYMNIFVEFEAISNDSIQFLFAQ